MQKRQRQSNKMERVFHYGTFSLFLSLPSFFLFLNLTCKRPSNEERAKTFVVRHPHKAPTSLSLSLSVSLSSPASCKIRAFKVQTDFAEKKKMLFFLPSLFLSLSVGFILSINLGVAKISRPSSVLPFRRHISRDDFLFFFSTCVIHVQHDLGMPEEKKKVPISSSLLSCR